MNWTDILWNIATAIVILLSGNVLGNWLTGIAASWLERTRLDPIVRRLLVSLVRPVIVVLAIFAALQQVGIPITTFAAMAGAITLAVGMSLQGSLSNVASGTLLLTFRPFNVGDVVTAGGQTGTVQALHLFSTTLHTPAGQTVTLPNDVVWKAPITNFSDRPTRRVRLVFTVPPDTPPDVVDAALKAAIAADERILAEPAAAVLYDEATDLGQPVAVAVHVANADYGKVLFALQRACYSELQAAGVTLATRADRRQVTPRG